MSIGVDALACSWIAIYCQHPSFSDDKTVTLAWEWRNEIFYHGIAKFSHLQFVSNAAPSDDPVYRIFVDVEQSVDLWQSVLKNYGGTSSSCGDRELHFLRASYSGSTLWLAHVSTMSKVQHSPEYYSV